MACIKTLVLTVCMVFALRDSAEGQGSEIFFNGDSPATISGTTLNLRRLISLSFRTCSHGELFYQAGNGGDYLVLKLLHGGQLEFRWRVEDEENATVVGSHLNNNQWHNILIQYELGNLFLKIDNNVTVISNSSLHPEIMNINLKNDRPKLIVGQLFTGCFIPGPGIPLTDPSKESNNVNWTPCPLEDKEECGSRTVDYCFSQPCHQRGICHSSLNGYSCQCTKRYTGENCQIDNGPLCASVTGDCLNGGICQEEKNGNSSSCACPSTYTGEFCEIRIDESFCYRNPCKNNGTCTVNNFSDGYVCKCVKGFAGVDCEININECLSSPCKNGGQCIDGIDSYNCDCQGTGYRGSHCQDNINECEENNPCLNGSRCYDRPGDYLCECPPGMSGDRCDQETDECLSQPCSNGAACIDFLDYYECHCLPGFEGTNCEINIDDCANITCPLHSECVDRINTHDCLCIPGYTGFPPNCTDVNECSSNPCHHGSTCIDLVNDFRCECPPGFSGSRCDLNIDDCQSMPCLNNARCIDIVNGYMCECLSGFTGLLCETDIDDCAFAQCKNGATCKDLVNGYNCSCAPGWAGQQCETNINECESNPCLNNATCQDLLNDFSCTCLPGFTGALCETNIDDCDPIPCLNGGTCHDLVMNYTCDCTDDFMGRNCSLTYNACAWDVCKNGGTCISSPPSHSYQCNCSLGFTGKNCEINIDDCEGVNCENNQICIDQVNTFECRCPDGYTGNDCSVDIDECSSNPCFNNSQCIDSISNFTCICPEGYTGHLCDKDIDECMDKPCKHGICHNYPGGYQCYCQPGFSGNNCNIDFDECLSGPCHNGGTCENLVNGYKCYCAPGFTGHDCDIDINECESEPCQNSGTCQDRVNAYLCQCIPGFTGIDCETNIDECASTPCQNLGHCIDKINGFECNCTDTGFKGDFCEINIDDCDPFPCTNEANCTDLVKDYRCECHIGYTGKTCEIDINECADHPCENEGLCLERSNLSLYKNNYLGLFPNPFNYSSAGGYLCHCVPGFRGENCSENIDDCDPDPCFNGTCIDGINNYTCQCFHGFEGNNCEIEIDECQRYQPCQEGATCYNTVGDYKCDCLPMYGGKNCNVELLGCVDNECKNNSTCIPYLIGEDQHNYNCSCSSGFYGNLCEYITTFSLNNSSLAVMQSDIVNNEYNLSFYFRTTLPYGILATSENFSDSFILELERGELNCKINSDLLNENIVIEEKINTAEWIYVNILFSTLHIEVKLQNGEKHFQRQVNLTQSKIWNFPKTYFGSVPGFSLNNGLIGCMQDVVINNVWMIPSMFRDDFRNIEIGCRRVDQCKPDPCSNHGKCTDLWTNFQCECNRPFLGKHCNYSYIPGTFGHERNISTAVINLPENDREILRNHVNISLFLRTRKPDGLVFYLGNQNPRDDIDYFALEISSGQPRISLKSHGKSSTLIPQISSRLDDGFYHLLEATITKSTEQINIGFVTLSLNDSVMLNSSVEIPNQNFYNLFLGNVPSSGRNKRQTSVSNNFSIGSQATSPFASSPSYFLNNEMLPNANDPPPFPSTRISDNSEANHFSNRFDTHSVSHSGDVIPSAFSSTKAPIPIFPSINFPVHKVDTSSPNEIIGIPFKGILQDVRINGKGVPFFPITIPGIIPIPSYSKANISNVLQGEVSDDTCKENPCVNSGTCEITWNDYRCLCSAEFRGKNCSQIEYCYRHSCPSSSECRSLDDGFECISNGTFDGISSIALYKADVLPNTSLNTFTFMFRSQRSGLILFLQDTAVGFIIKVHISGSKLVIEQESYAEQDSQVNLTMGSNATDGEWHSVSITFEDTYIVAGFDEITKSVNVSHSFSVSAIIRNSEIYVGGPPPSFVHNHLYYRGCLKELRIGGFLLPFFKDDEIINNTSSQRFSVKKLDNINSTACILCNESECYNNGKCANPLESYNCNCSFGYEGHHCEYDINECEFEDCHNGECHNLPGNYTCICQRGFTGSHCESDINECEFSEICQNGGTCINSFGNYDCLCNVNYTGINCEQLITITCDHKPCQHGATCHSKEKREILASYYDYRCECTAGYTGRDCKNPIDFCAPMPCFHGSCKNKPERATFECECNVGFTGLVCDININECESGPCQNNATCVDGIGKATCECKPGFDGNTCEHDIDECLIEDLCKNGGTCNNTHGSYECNCIDPYMGKNCTLKNPCRESNNTLCHNGGECLPDEQGLKGEYFFCQCPSNFGGDYCKTEKGSFDMENLAIVIGPVIGIILLIAIVAITIFFMMARKKRATRGTYSPSRQEMFGSRVEMGNVMKPPPEERLI